MGTSFTVGTALLGGAAVAAPGVQAYEARKMRKASEAEASRIKEEEEKKTKQLAAETAAEKKRVNEKAMERLRRRGHAGTILGGETDTSLLGSVI